MADDEKRTAFEDAESGADAGLLQEFIEFLTENRKFWLIPILIVLLLLGALVAFAPASPMAPFIYTLF